jgi:hypothetical protein
MPDHLTDEFDNADLGDARRNRRLGQVAQWLGNSPGSSISAACGGWSECMAAFRLLNCVDYSAADLIAPHQAKTMERSAGHPCVVVAQDTTEFDYTHMKKTKGLGALNGEARKGFFMHSLYAVSEQGLPLGLLDVSILMRDAATLGSSKSRKGLPIDDKESFRWLQGYHKTSELARQMPDCEVFSVSDREGDIHEVFNAWQEAGDKGRAQWIIRANQDRALEKVVPGKAPKLFEALEAAPVLGEIEFDVRARNGWKKVKGNNVWTTRSARTVRQVIRARKITPRPPARKGGKLEAVSFWAVLAEETDPPEGEEPIRWLLLTSKEVTTIGQARRILNLYLRRWDIEVFHKVLKTGCRVERIQLKKETAVIHAVMVYSVIAWRILYLTHLGRQCPEMPCGSVFEEAEWKGCRGTDAIGVHWNHRQTRRPPGSQKRRGTRAAVDLARADTSEGFCHCVAFVSRKITKNWG